VDVAYRAQNELGWCICIYTFSEDCCTDGVDFLKQMKILRKTLVSVSVSESVLSLSLGIISNGSCILSTNNNDAETCIII